MACPGDERCLGSQCVSRHGYNATVEAMAVQNGQAAVIVGTGFCGGGGRTSERGIVQNGVLTSTRPLPVASSCSDTLMLDDAGGLAVLGDADRGTMELKRYSAQDTLSSSATSAPMAASSNAVGVTGPGNSVGVWGGDSRQAVIFPASGKPFSVLLENRNVDHVGVGYGRNVIAGNRGRLLRVVDDAAGW